MEPLSKILSQAGIIHTTNFNHQPEPYILTDEEGFDLIEHEVAKRLKYYAWKFSKRSRILQEQELLGKIDSIDLALEIDVVAILEHGNSNKHYQLWQSAKREDEKKREENILAERKKTWTAGMMLRHMRWVSQNRYGKLFIEDTHTLPLIKAVCFFLSEDERFETELGFSLEKGLLIRGICGLGKTFVVKCAAENDLNPISIFSLIEIADVVKNDGEFNIPINQKGKLYLDDVGSEVASTVNHYGTKVNWFKDFLETYYLRNQQYNRLIISTNCSANQLEERYGFRVRSRLKDMFNMIDVTGNDLRGNG
jgi:hypothetical protein